MIVYYPGRINEDGEIDVVMVEKSSPTEQLIDSVIEVGAIAVTIAALLS